MRKPNLDINWIGETIPQLQVRLELERDWMEDGKCYRAPKEVADLFFAFGKGADFRAACDLCNVCPVKSLCYAYALIYGERGTWGGTNQSERDERRPFVVGEVVELWPLLYQKWQGQHEAVDPNIYPAQDVDVPRPKRPKVVNTGHERARNRAGEGVAPGALLGRRNPRVVSQLRKDVASADAPET